MKTTYFIALIPPDPLKKKIMNLKYQFAKKYDSFKSLNSPPHITLIPPFDATAETLFAVRDHIECEVQNFRPFTVEIDGFGAFKPKVIFLKVSPDKDTELLRQGLSERISESPDAKSHPGKPFRPHITLAFRDLSPENFRRARNDYQKRAFKERFEVESVFLLQHTGKRWEILREFPFGGSAA